MPAGAQRSAPVRLAELFKVGIGPSSSHTIGPMKAAAMFVAGLSEIAAKVDRMTGTAFGSLAWTGRGHATDKAMALGLAGFLPENIEPAIAREGYAQLLAEKTIRMPDGRNLRFDPTTDIIFDTITHFERHPNAMAFEAFNRDGASLVREVWYSIGGGFVEREGETTLQLDGESRAVPYPYSTAQTLLVMARAAELSIAELVAANEAAHQSAASVDACIERCASVMLACIDEGLSADGELPGGLRVRRRAKQLFEKLEAARLRNDRSPNETMSYVSTFAIAVNEENAAGGRVVTAPTNGAAGVIPAVLRYYRDFCNGASPAGIRVFFLAATAIGGIIKQNASISGAEVGCQGEVGSAAAMAAAGLAAALGGSNEQVENAAEIAMEHHLGMTCDPIGGLVQIPCIERNAFGAVKAINAAHLALHGDGMHRVSLDQAIEAMRQTGADMSEKYRETSRGGLAVNVPEC